MPFDSLDMPLARDFVAPHGTDPVLEALVEARALCVAVRRKGNPCITNAIASVTDPSLPTGAYSDACTYVALLVPENPVFADPIVRLWKWHDAATTTHADVLALFDRAIAARRSEV